ncbi:hypothetical protein JVT61DRAFT_9277 [Boletus reticuloceps]|uniref:Uncharacterized protein n=1 Tax=Boletus reticuloceps TaxID=495285 RepID=A0A8I3A6J7_9AGAM|nr:hypothetical protein JVT61DRAFT_9277 [Boletus reticuloceps]
MLYGGTSSVNYKLMHEATCCRLVRSVQPFGLDPNDFAQILHTHRAVVSGSFALFVFDRSGGWTPEDMDVYVPRGRMGQVINLLRALGYIPIRAVSKANSYHPYDQPIRRVTTLTNGVRSIDVVESSTRSSLSPIFQFHTTAVMNYISLNGFFCAYPTLTSQRRALVNHVRLNDNSPTDKLVTCYSKYICRGFELRTSSIVWDEREGRKHRCQHSFDCPHRIRTPFDPGNLFVRWRPSVSRLQSFEIDYPQRCFDGRQAPSWCLGGPSCVGDEDREPLRAFVSMKAAGSPFAEEVT